MQYLSGKRRTAMGGLIRRAVMAAGATALVLAGTLTAAHASTTAPVPAGVEVSHMTYQPGMHLPATPLPRLTPAHGTLTSQNWAGYVDVACRTCTLRFVTASFTLPSVNCARSPNGSLAGFWAGLDGVTGTTVEQIGAIAGCSRGAASYAAFYEMYPKDPVYFSGVSPGDAIKVSVYFNASTHRWQLRLSDMTTGGSISTTGRLRTGQVPGNPGHQSARAKGRHDLERPVDHPRDRHAGQRRSQPRTTRAGSHRPGIPNHLVRSQLTAGPVAVGCHATILLRDR